MSWIFCKKNSGTIYKTSGNSLFEKSPYSSTIFNNQETSFLEYLGNFSEIL